jgi:hypothetical protein
MGGALGDTSWITKGETPLISYHVTSDAFAPCKTGILRVPTARGPEPVVEVSGSCDVAAIMDRIGNNDFFKNIIPSKDPYNAYNKSGNLGFISLMVHLMTQDHLGNGLLPLSQNQTNNLLIVIQMQFLQENIWIRS